MAIFDLRSRREKRKHDAGKEDVLRYDDLPEPFRVQVTYLFHELLGNYVDEGYLSMPRPGNDGWRKVYDIFRREKGVYELIRGVRDNPNEQLCNYLLRAAVDDALDLIELIFRYGITVPRNRHDPYQAMRRPGEIVAELNGRFRQHALGYEFVNDEIIRIDSKYIHAEAVKPALSLLHGAGKGFAGALDEFMKAHEHYRKGENKDAVVWALKAFESTMKSICVARRWSFDANRSTAKDLLTIVFEKQLIPDYMQAEFTALRSVLESGLPTVRNKNSGHGQGPEVRPLPDHFARYALNLAASNIVFLIECHQG